jgi:hypothetical protein
MREAETEMLLGLQLGLRKESLRAWMEDGRTEPADASILAGVLNICREMTQHPGVVAVCVRSACAHLGEGRREEGSAKAELSEMAALWESAARLYFA